MRRISLLLLALLVVALASASVATFAPARGQTPVPTEETRIFPFSVVPSNGYASIADFGGFSEGILEATCAGRNPLGGPVVPLAVITNLRSHDILVRVVSWAPGGHFAVINNTTVLVGCSIDAPTSFWEGAAVAAKATQLRQHARQ
jgi:hypothetical protein